MGKRRPKADPQMPWEQLALRLTSEEQFAYEKEMGETAPELYYGEGCNFCAGTGYRGRTGVARMVLEAGVPVVPVAMIGTAEVMPIGTRVPKVRRVGIVFGEALDFSRFEGMEGDRFVLRSVTDELVYDLRALSDQEYVDVYASSVREQRATQSR